MLIWQTDSVPGTFKVEYGQGTTLESVSKLLTAKVSSVTLRFRGVTTLLYRAQLSKLSFDDEYVYRVTLNDQPVTTAVFGTRTRKFQTRFAVFGDCGAGTVEQAKIAYQVYQKKPQFVLIPGDNVYSDGLARNISGIFSPFTSPKSPIP